MHLDATGGLYRSDTRVKVEDTKKVGQRATMNTDAKQGKVLPSAIELAAGLTLLTSNFAWEMSELFNAETVNAAK